MTNSRWTGVALALLLLFASGCAALGLGGDRDARRLLAQAHEKIDRHDLPAAWSDLREIRLSHADSPVCAEAFPVAAAVFQRLYFRERLNRDSAWMQTEPGFMLDWFAAFFGGADFPEAEARALFVGMPYGYFRDYQAYAAARPALARFDASAEEDDGIIESVAARPH
jgi:hypothetical protein